MKGCLEHNIVFQQQRPDLKAAGLNFAHLKRKYQKQWALLNEETEKVSGMTKKEVFSNEDIEYCKQFIPFVIELDDCYWSAMDKLKR